MSSMSGASSQAARAVAEAMEVMRSQMSELAATQSQLNDELRESQRQRAEWEAERAAAARAGDLGPEWRDMQRRIDAGESSLDALLLGKDKSAAGEALQDRIVDSVPQLREQFLDETRAHPEELEGYAQATNELLTLVQELRAMQQDLRF